MPTMAPRPFHSHKADQLAEGRAAQRRMVNDICRSMKTLPTRKPVYRTVYNEALGRYVELR